MNLSNLFKVNLDEIIKVLEEANKPIINKYDTLNDEAKTVLSIPIKDNVQAEKYNRFLGKIRRFRKEINSTRLNDGRPFTNATKKIKEWFDHYNDGIKSIDEQLSSMLSNYTNTVIEQVESSKTQEISETDSNSKSEVIGFTESGKPLVEINNSDNTNDYLEQIKIPNIKAEWYIEEFNREEIDLESLRDFFSESALNNAIKNHLKTYGANKLKGVSYKRKV